MSYLVLNVRPWNVTGEDGIYREGATATYIDLDSRAVEGEVGLPVLELTISTQQMREFSEAPGLYDMSFTQRRGARGKAALEFVRASLVQSVEFQ